MCNENENDFENEDNLEDEPKRKPFWKCEECGHTDKIKAIPTDKEKYYERLHKFGNYKCPKCKSESFVLYGF
jgi:Zn finger protein HypA/HybF involved in hydrogenase expression